MSPASAIAGAAEDAGGDGGGEATNFWVVAIRGGAYECNKTREHATELESDRERRAHRAGPRFGRLWERFGLGQRGAGLRGKKPRRQRGVPAH